MSDSCTVHGDKAFSVVQDEISEWVTGQGRAEDIGRKALLTESLNIFKLQQECAHKNGLKTTIQMTCVILLRCKFGAGVVLIAAILYLGAEIEKRSEKAGP